MRHIFMDETGDLGFGTGTKYLIIAIISPESGTTLNKKFKNFSAHLVKAGWNDGIEIKAAALWHAPKNVAIGANYKYKNKPEEPIEYALEEIAKLDCFVEYLAVKLGGVPEAYRRMGNAELYKIFAWEVLRSSLCSFPSVHLCVDRRDRHRDGQMKFNGFIEGKTSDERAQHNLPPLNLKISHHHYHAAEALKAEARADVEFGIRGLQAADFVCWAIKRKFENDQEAWHKKIQPRIRAGYHLYFDK